MNSAATDRALAEQARIQPQLLHLLDALAAWAGLATAAEAETPSAESPAETTEAPLPHRSSALSAAARPNHSRPAPTAPRSEAPRLESPRTMAPREPVEWPAGKQPRDGSSPLAPDDPGDQHPAPIPPMHRASLRRLAGVEPAPPDPVAGDIGVMRAAAGGGVSGADRSRPAPVQALPAAAAPLGPDVAPALRGDGPWASSESSGQSATALAEPAAADTTRPRPTGIDGAPIRIEPLRGAAPTWPATSRSASDPLASAWPTASRPGCDPLASAWPISEADPFADSALEEQMAEALERAAREAGVDLS